MGHENNHSAHHVVPFKYYLNVLLALLFLTVLTVAVAKPVSGFDAGILNAFIAMAIASLKAGLVGAIFMHLWWDTKLYTSILIISVFFLLVMFAFSWLDIVSRVKEISTL